MATQTLIGNWNLFTAGSSEGKVTVRNATAQIEAGPDGSLSCKLDTGATFKLSPSEASGYSAAIGNQLGGHTENAVIIVQSQDGKMFYGANKISPAFNPEAWWGVRQ